MQLFVITMQLNLYGILSVALAISSLFLPWVSSYLSRVSIYGMIVHSMDIAPHIRTDRSGFCLPNCSSFSFSYDADWKWMPWPRICSSWYLSDIFLGLLVAAFLIYAYSICLTIHGTFANGSWGRAGKKSLMVTSFLSLSSILLYLGSLLAYLNISYEISPFNNGLFVYEGIMGEAKFTYFNIGFLVALLGTLLAFLSWLRPKFVNLTTGTRIEGYDKLRDFLSIPEKEKLMAIFLSSFLVVLLFTIFYFILPLINI